MCLLGLAFLMSLFLSVFGLNCWTGLESEADPARWKMCDLKRGFRTCYTKYDPLGQLAGRGCSSKEKLYREHCEVHEMDGLVEKFCYCSFNLCNRSFVNKGTPISLLLSTLLPFLKSLSPS
eukprot:TRINITY_DN14209_c0_g1_i2.p1 TRINITY_DN14209_c0_g1~~TRINITY_DN14209_c0_g1_i2.p1  ORF type:complete len:121 (+),score=12.50 TRINITY_DN14209_c0_g1_i2:266-628(+)